MWPTIGGSAQARGSGCKRRGWWFLNAGRVAELAEEDMKPSMDAGQRFKQHHTTTAARAGDTEHSDVKQRILQGSAHPNDEAESSAAATPETSISHRNHPSSSADHRSPTTSSSSSQPVLTILQLLLLLCAVNHCFSDALGPVVGNKLATAVVMLLVGRPRGWSGAGSKKSLRSSSPASLRPPRLAHIVLTIFFIVFVVGCLAKIVSLLLSSPEPWATDVPTVIRTWDLDPSIFFKTEYQTSFTRDIHPRPVHSHNDYWRQIPLFMALTVGTMGVEADVWAYENELYVGHDAPSLSRNRTFKGLYVDPLRTLLDKMNAPSEIGVINGDGRKLRGVYDSEPDQTLNLYVDLKTPGAETLPVVIAHLDALRSPVNYLTHFNGTHTNHGPVTVHLTGDTPFDLFLASNTTYRDYFFDAPVTELDSGKYNTTNSLMSSTPFHKNVGRVTWGSGGVTDSMLKTIRKHVKSAHDRGIGIRYWGTPGWPISVRNKVWKVLVREGVDLLNADDIKAAVMLEW